MNKLRIIHPGGILQVEFLSPMRHSAYRLSMDIGIPQSKKAREFKAIKKYKIIVA